MLGTSAQGVLNSAKGVGTEVCMVITHTRMEVLGLLKSRTFLHLFGYIWAYSSGAGWQERGTVLWVAVG